MFKKGFTVFLIITLVWFNGLAVFCAQETKYPDYAYEFLGADRWEKVNRKIFNFNHKLNKYAIRPIHILWASIMPQYAMDRIKGVSDNIEYPIRLISSLLQRDFKTSKDETVRFVTNTVIGLGGMFDPAKHLFNIEQAKENMEQALDKCHVKTGQYFVLPVLSFTNVRGMFGKVLDMALNPTCYIASPILAIIKAGLTVNRTSFIQPFLKMVESTFADPYDIQKKAFGFDSYIKCANLDRVDVVQGLRKEVSEIEKISPSKPQVIDVKKVTQDKKDDTVVKMEVTSEIVIPDLLYGGANIDENLGAENFKLGADIILKGYNPQCPVVDSMRTALFEIPEVNKSIWNDMSIWNRSFANRIKTGSVNLADNRDDYKFRYILQRDKNSPLAIIYPSVGEGINSAHSVLFAKIFYDLGYSVVIQGSHFQWEFVKSMPQNYRPGLPSKDADVLRFTSAKIIDVLSKKYNCEFGHKVIIGTSFGAMAALFVGAKERSYNTLGDVKYISICPPIDLIYAMKQVDKISQDWKDLADNFKDQTASTAAKVVKLYTNKGDLDFEINNLPFSEQEGKLITGFIMHQKLSDIIYTVEKSKDTQSSDIYNEINNMGYEDYTRKYLLPENQTCDDIAYEVSLNSISNFLENSKDYKIYHSLNDYLTNSNQLKKLKQYSGKNLVLVDNGAHLGFLYRKEFLDDLKNTISLK